MEEERWRNDFRVIFMISFHNIHNQLSGILPDWVVTEIAIVLVVLLPI